MTANRYEIRIDHRTNTLAGVPLEEAARQVAQAHRDGSHVEAFVEDGTNLRILTQKETEALAVAATWVLHNELSDD